MLICEGFVGNVVLKVSEGIAEYFVRTFQQDVVGRLDQDREMAGRMLSDLARRYQYHEHGGAPLLGIDGICIICHGSSNARSITNALASGDHLQPSPYQRADRRRAGRRGGGLTRGQNRVPLSRARRAARRHGPDDRRKAPGRAATLRAGRRNLGLRPVTTLLRGAGRRTRHDGGQPAGDFCDEPGGPGIASGRKPAGGRIVRNHGRLEPGGIHGSGVCRGAVLRRRSPRRSAPRRGHAAGLGQDAVGHGQRPALGPRKGGIDPRSGLCGRIHRDRQFSLSRKSGPLGRESGLREGGRIGHGRGGQAVPLAVAGAFHTKLMQPADERLAEALASVTISKPRIPVISNVDAQSHDDPETIRQNLVRQVVSPVRWEDSMRSMLGQGVNDFYEIGPGKVLRGLLKRIDRKVDCQTVNDSP